MCAKHPLSVATLTCARCGSFACSVCERQANDGEGVCEACVPCDQSFVLAERAARFIANMIDNFLFGAAVLPGAIGLVVFSESREVGGALLLIGLVTLAWFGFVQIRHARSGRSIGKKAQGIRVVRTDGSPVSLWRILLLRNLILGVVGNLVSLVALVDTLMIFGQERRCLHDYLAGTVVVLDQGEP